MLRVERVAASDIQAYGPVKVQFSFLLGYDVFLAVTAEVTEMRDGDQTTGHDVTILEAVQENGSGELFPYGEGCHFLRRAIEGKAVECSHNEKYFVR